MHQTLVHNGSPRWLSLVVCLALCFAVAGVSGGWTASEVPGWYRTLHRPSFAPPDWIFGPVWTLLYTLMAIAVWRVWLAPASPTRTLGIAIFLVQLALNFAWTWIFFHQHWLGSAVLEIAALELSIFATILLFRHVSVAAAWMLVPYLAWVTFAAVLNFAFWRLNTSIVGKL